jgi:hypothetical protein
MSIDMHAGNAHKKGSRLYFAGIMLNALYRQFFIANDDSALYQGRQLCESFQNTASSIPAFS